MLRRAYPALTLFGTLLALLLSGCQATAPRPPGQSAVTSPAPVTVSESQQALASADYTGAAKLFARQLQQDGELPEEDYYHYGLALEQTGDFDGAIAQLTYYIENVGRHGNNFYPALEARDRALEKQQQLAEQAERSAATQTAQSQLGAAASGSWQQVAQQLTARAASLVEPLTGMELLLVEGGCFQMGDLFGDGRENERPVREVCVDAFYLGKTEVTQGQWRTIMGYNPSAFADKGNDHPVEQVSWEEASQFARLLGGGQGTYRLPSEAEWEYAARSGGQQQKYSGGDDLDAVAWHEENSNGSTQPVTQKQPNALGFYDMSGNVYEWCLDKEVVTVDEQPREEGGAEIIAEEYRARRGGGWDSRANYQRTSFRRTSPPSEYRADDVGFRLALPAPAGP